MFTGGRRRDVQAGWSVVVFDERLEGVVSGWGCGVGLVWCWTGVLRRGRITDRVCRRRSPSKIADGDHRQAATHNPQTTCGRPRFAVRAPRTHASRCRFAPPFGADGCLLEASGRSASCFRSRPSGLLIRGTTCFVYRNLSEYCEQEILVVCPWLNGGLSVGTFTIPRFVA